MRWLLDEPLEQVQFCAYVYVNAGPIVSCARRIARIQTLNSLEEQPVETARPTRSARTLPLVICPLFSDALCSDVVAINACNPEESLA